MLSWLQGAPSWEVDLLLAAAHTRGCGIRVSERVCSWFPMRPVWDYCLQTAVAWSPACCHHLRFDFCQALLSSDKSIQEKDSFTKTDKILDPLTFKDS